MAIKIQVPEFDRMNNNVIKHAFLANVSREASLDDIGRNYSCDDRFATLNQIHSSACHVIDDDYQMVHDGDALVTRDSGITLCVFAADCVPVLLADSENRVISAIHSGWRGAKNGIISNAVSVMKEIGANIKKIKAAIGPAIKQRNYEVGREFRDEFLHEHNSNENFFVCVGESLFFDLQSYVICKLESCGVSRVNIYNSEIDTYSNYGIASYRRCVKHNLPNSYTNAALISLSKSEDRQGIHNSGWNDCIHSIKKAESNRATVSKMDSVRRYWSHSSQEESQEAFNIPPSSHKDGVDVNYLERHDSKKLLKKLKKGSIMIEDQIDLHGLNQDESFFEVKNFILRNYSRGFRYLLVIVGKGMHDEGIIRSSIREWLESDSATASILLLLEEALPQHGGSGSFYVFLRRRS